MTSLKTQRRLCRLPLPTSHNRPNTNKLFGSLTRTHFVVKWQSIIVHTHTHTHTHTYIHCRFCFWRSRPGPHAFRETCLSSTLADVCSLFISVSVFFLVFVDLLDRRFFGCDVREAHPVGYNSFKATLRSFYALKEQSQNQFDGSESLVCEVRITASHNVWVLNT